MSYSEFANSDDLTNEPLLARTHKRNRKRTHPKGAHPKNPKWVVVNPQRPASAGNTLRLGASLSASCATRPDDLPDVGAGFFRWLLLLLFFSSFSLGHATLFYFRFRLSIWRIDNKALPRKRLIGCDRYRNRVIAEVAIFGLKLEDNLRKNLEWVFFLCEWNVLC